jgi:GNAT superfamily N-acetyltransferase
VIFRAFNPDTDSVEVLARLNVFTPETQAKLAVLYDARPMQPGSVIVADHDGELVGCYHIFDSGLPWAYLDGMYVKPAYRGIATIRGLLRAAERELQRRGVVYARTFGPQQAAHVLEYFGWRRGSGHPDYVMHRRF